MNVPLYIESSYQLRNLRQKIDIRKVDLAKEIASGLVSDFVDYRYRIGVLSGLDEALQLIDELEKTERN
jgi:hypothetical protein